MHLCLNTPAHWTRRTCRQPVHLRALFSRSDPEPVAPGSLARALKSLQDPVSGTDTAGIQSTSIN